MTQALCTLLALLLALAGGPLSLCRCGPGEPVVAPTGDCCPPPEATPAEAGCCCCQAPPASDPVGPRLAGHCDCPQLDLSPSPAESAPGTSAAAAPQVDHLQLLAAMPPPGPALAALGGGGGAIRDGPAPLAARIPLYLLHQNLRH